MTQILLDRPEVSQVLFYPRRAYGSASALTGVRLVGVEVEPGIVLGGRLYPAAPDSPAILFFHGNGEIAKDYGGIASLYTRLGITLLVMDYRGHHKSRVCYPLDLDCNTGTGKARWIVHLGPTVNAVPARGRPCDST